ncbi:MAG: 16S rRNA (cytosine(967)-C(5))-methyltransferase RsmB, partial [Clostridia bacterium]|nr:16S rRNA (cytosine(967)-C(5))-methyltransferase RsmB [Clostridia bacterium]
MEQALNPARALALQILNKTDSAGQYTNLALDSALKKSNLSAPDKALVTILVYGVTERRLTLDYMADALSSRPMETLDGTVRNLVRMGLYQLRYLDRIPAHAAVSETVSLAPRRARGFVNAVLREYTRRGDDLPFPDKASDPYRCLSVTYSIPVPLCKKLCEIFGM